MSLPKRVVHRAHLADLTRDWGTRDEVSLYLDRCRVDTPHSLIAATWRHVFELRDTIGKVVDFGAGDGRFAHYGRYDKYVGYEIDFDRCSHATYPRNARLLNRCAFAQEVLDANLCIGNPPFVRNQDLPEGWRQQASSILERRTGVKISGLANAWQYFFLLSLASAKWDGLVALVVPYEWVSRPSAETLRDYIRQQKWAVSVYRLVDTTFDGVLTTSSITLVDKARQTSEWNFFEETAKGVYQSLHSPSGSSRGVLGYLRPTSSEPRAVRGVSPGTQKVLTLTEGDCVRFGLAINRDVVPCVTTLRHLPGRLRTLSEAAFRRYYRLAGQKCWLIRTDKPTSRALRSYLDAVPRDAYQTATCLERNEWWKFTMPPIPGLLVATSFRGKFPKTLNNIALVRAVGGVAGIHNLSRRKANVLL
jgi:hypothetical protein